MHEEHKFFTGMYAFEGRGLEEPVSLEPRAVYTVPPNKRAQFIYGRIGNPTTEFLYVALQRDGKSVRLFPCGPKAGITVPLAIIDDAMPGSVSELKIGAPKGLAAKVMIDVGFVEFE
jgi:assimilatory nitrate reductase catalytic subunit